MVSNRAPSTKRRRYAQSTAPTAQDIAQSNATLQHITGNTPRWQHSQPLTNVPSIRPRANKTQAQPRQSTAQRSLPQNSSALPALHLNTTDAISQPVQSKSHVDRSPPTPSHPVHPPSATPTMTQLQPTAAPHNNAAIIEMDRRISQPGQSVPPGNGGTALSPPSHMPGPTGGSPQYPFQQPELLHHSPYLHGNARSTAIPWPQPTHHLQAPLQSHQQAPVQSPLQTHPQPTPQSYPQPSPQSRSQPHIVSTSHQSLQPPNSASPRLPLASQPFSQVVQAGQQQRIRSELNTQSVPANSTGTRASPTGTSAPTIQSRRRPLLPFRRSATQMLSDLNIGLSQLRGRAVPSAQLHLLQKAVFVCDTHYLVLHQILCLHKSGLLSQAFPQNELPQDTVNEYMKMSGQIIAATPHTMEFFHTFPESLNTLCDDSQQEYKANRGFVTSVVNMIKKTVEGRRFCVEWCTSQQFLPLVEDLVQFLQVNSPMLQHMMFLDLRHLVSKGKQGPELSVLEHLHLIDQDTYHQKGYRRSVAERKMLHMHYNSLIRCIGMQDSPLVGHKPDYIPPSMMVAFSKIPDSMSCQYTAGQSRSTRDATHPAPAATQAGLPPASQASAPVPPLPPPSHVLRSNTIAPPANMQTPASNITPAMTQTSMPPVVGPHMSHTPASMAHPLGPPWTSPHSLPTSSIRGGMMSTSSGPPMPHASAVISQAPRASEASAMTAQAHTQPRMVPPSTRVPSQFMTHSTIPNPPTRVMPDKQTPDQAPLLYPSLDQLPPQPARPNSAVMAIHLAHLRSPTLKSVDTQQEASNLYRCVMGYALRPTKLPRFKPILQMTFPVSKAALAAIPRAITSVPNYAALPVVLAVAEGSCWFRLRCVKMPPDGFPTEVSWVLTDTHWSHDMYLECNEKILEPRRKMYFSKDLPIDLTALVGPGPNSIKVMMTDRTDSPNRDTNQYALAVEVVRCVSHESIIQNLQRIPTDESIEAIKKLLAGDSAAMQANGNGDDSDDDGDMTVTSTSLTINLFDPYSSSKIFDLPVRGLTCRHRDCFDLETFLANCKRPDEDGPTVADCWRCPMCRGDVRPQSLVVDEFLVDVRAELARRNQLDTRAIVVDPDGSWRPKLEGRSNPHGARPRLNRVKQRSSPLPGPQPQDPTPMDVIEID